LRSLRTLWKQILQNGLQNAAALVLSCGAPEEIRTPDPQIRRLPPYDKKSRDFCKPHAFGPLRHQWFSCPFANRARDLGARRHHRHHNARSPIVRPGLCVLEASRRPAQRRPTRQFWRPDVCNARRWSRRAWLSQTIRKLEGHRCTVELPRPNLGPAHSAQRRAQAQITAEALRWFERHHRNIL
jgi:hypothetical protein